MPSSAYSFIISHPIAPHPTCKQPTGKTVGAQLQFSQTLFTKGQTCIRYIRRVLFLTVVKLLHLQYKILKPYINNILQYNTLLCSTMWYDIVVHHTTCHVMPCHVRHHSLQRHMILDRIMRHQTSESAQNYLVAYHTTSQVTPCNIIPCYVILHCVTLLHIIPHCTISYRSMPDQITPYHPMLCHIMSYYIT